MLVCNLPLLSEGDDMYRTRFIFGVSVLFLAAGMTACQGRGDGQKPTTPATTAKATTSSTHKTKPPAKTTTRGANAQHTAPAATAKTQPSHETTAKTANAATPKATPPAPAKSLVDNKPSTTATPASKPTDKVQLTAKTTDKPLNTAKPADTKLAKTDKPKPTTTPVPTSTKMNAAPITATQLTPVQEQLKQNTNLTAKVAPRLPTGTDVIKAADGFASLGQFVAAVNVSSNLQLSFADLKTKLIDGKMSLSQAIQALRPLTASPTIEAQRAEYDARGIIAESEQQPAQTVSSGTMTTAPKQKATGKKPTQ